MIKVDFEKDDFDGLYDRLKIVRQSLTERGVQKWFDLLLGDGSISIETTLKDNIMDLVYMKPTEMIVNDEYRSVDKPNFYERTERLHNATKVIIRGNEIHLFMDDEALGDRGSLTDMSKGTATNLSETPYSLRVENDFIYENNYGVDVLRKGDKYMEKTYQEIKGKILAGELNPKRILTPVLGVWKG